MNKRDYIREVESLRTPDHLRRRIASLPSRRTARSFRWGRLLSLAACLVLVIALAVALPALLRGLYPGGEIVSPPVATGSNDAIPDEKLAQLLAAEFPGGQQPGDTWELLCYISGNGCTLGVLRYEGPHAFGLGSLFVGVFDNRTREPVEPVTIINGDDGEVYTWVDTAAQRQYLLCTNAVVTHGAESCTAALFSFDSSRLSTVTELPDVALEAENLPQGAETMFQSDTTFWEDHKGVINGAGLDLYERNPDWDAASAKEDDQWFYLCYVPLAAEEQAPLTDITGPTQTDPTVGFDWYNPPVLPLIVDGDSTGLRTWRKLTVDLTGGLSGEQVSADALRYPSVTDRYVVENNSGRDLTVTLCYPQANNLTASSTALPSITLDGYQQDNTPLIGGALPDVGDSWTGDFTTWEDYRDAMDSGDAFSGAKADPVGMLAGVPVAVYDIVPSQDYEAIQDSLDAPWSVTLAVECTLSDPEAQVFLYGMEGYVPLSEDQLSRRYSFALNDNAAGLHRIIVVGGTLETGSVTGYTDGSFTQTVPELSGQVSAKESLSLSDALLDCVEDFYYQPEGSVYYTEDTVQRVLCDLIVNYVCGPSLSNALYGDPNQGVMADAYAENAAFIRVDDLISTVSGMLRFLFWTYDVTIPAGGHVILEATQQISLSGSLTRDEDDYLVVGAPYGFDFAPTLAGSPPLESLELEVIHGDGLTVSESNFNLSFDGYGAVSYLDPTAERYFFSVSGKK